MKALILFFLTALSALAQVTNTTAQPLARDATTYNLNRSRLDIGTGTTFKLEDGSTLTIEDGTAFSIGSTAAQDFVSALNIGFGMKTFADSSARLLSVPAIAGQVGFQVDDGTFWFANSTTTGDWNGLMSSQKFLAYMPTDASTPHYSFGASPTSGLYFDFDLSTVGLSYNGSSFLSSDGATVAFELPTTINGALTANSFVGSGSGITGLPLTGLTGDTTTALGIGSINLGHASDTTIARSAAGTVTIEGVTVATASNTLTLTNKTINGSNNTITNVSLTTGVTGTLPVANGGTGKTTAPFILAELSGTQTVTNSTTFVDVTGLSVSLPAGTWEITYFAGFVNDSSAGCRLQWVTDQNVKVAIYDMMAAVNGLVTVNYVASDSVTSNTRQVAAPSTSGLFRHTGIIVTSTTTTFKLQMANHTASGSSVIQDNAFILARRIDN